MTLITPQRALDQISSTTRTLAGIEIREPGAYVGGVYVPASYDENGLVIEAGTTSYAVFLPCIIETQRDQGRRLSEGNDQGYEKTILVKPEIEIPPTGTPGVPGISGQWGDENFSTHYKGIPIGVVLYSGAILPSYHRITRVEIIAHPLLPHPDPTSPGAPFRHHMVRLHLVASNPWRSFQSE